MVKKHKKLILRISCFVAALFVVASSFLVVPSSATTSDVNGTPMGLCYLDYSFDLDIKMTKKYDNVSPTLLGVPLPHSVYLKGVVNNPVVDTGLVGSGGSKHYFAYGGWSVESSYVRYSVKSVSDNINPNYFAGNQVIKLSLNKAVFWPQFCVLKLCFPVATKIEVIEEGFAIEVNDTDYLIQQITFPVNGRRTYTLNPNQEFSYNPYFVGNDFVLTKLDIIITVSGENFSTFDVCSSFSDNNSGANIESFFAERDFVVDKDVTINETPFPANWTDWLFDVIGGFLDFEVLPGLSFGGIFAAIVGVILIWFILHLFM